jgi:hypothetical protein
MQVLARSLALVLCVVLIGWQASAQSVTVSSGIIYRDEVPYARMHTNGVLHPSFSFRTLTGTEFMMMHYDDAAENYRVTFLPGGEQTRLPARYGSPSVMAQEVVDNNLVTDSAFNPAGLKRFMLAHPADAALGSAQAKRAANTSLPDNSPERSPAPRRGDAVGESLEEAVGGVAQVVSGIGNAIERAFDKFDSSAREPSRPSGAGNGTVKRSRSADVLVVGSELQQDSKTIGRFGVISSTVKGKLYQTYSFRLPSGALVATATLEGADATSTTVVTVDDNKETTLTVDGRDKAKTAKKIATYLANRYYL